MLLLLLTLSCKAQTIVNLKDYDGNAIQDYYYKDINNLLNPFEGTYIYTNGTTSLKIVLLKKTMRYNGYNFEDDLVGEYQYIKNGVEISNTLADITINHDDLPNDHLISAGCISQYGEVPFCQGCTPGEIRVFGTFSDVHGNFGQLIIRKLIVNNQPAIEINVSWETRYRKPNDPVRPGRIFSGGDYILIKQ